jgi:hypothetical protein
MPVIPVSHDFPEAYSLAETPALDRVMKGFSN